MTTAASPAGDDVSDDVVNTAATTPTQHDDATGATPADDKSPGAKAPEGAPDGKSPDPAKDEPQTIEAVVERAAKAERAKAPGKKPEVATKNVAERNADRSSSTPEKGKAVDPKAEAKSEEDIAKEKAEDERFDKHPRFKELRGQVAQRDKVIAEYKPKAEQFDQITGFMKEQNLNNDEVGQLFQVGALLKNDPMAAYKAIEPIWRKLEALVGDVLPADIQDRLDKGLVDEDTARELARQRGTASVRAGQDALAMERKRQADAEAETQRRADDEAKTRANFAGAVDAYWATLAKRDPDLADKEDLVEGRMAVLIRNEGMPSTPEQAVEMTKRAYAEVNKTFGRFGGSTVAKRPGPGSQSNGRGAQPGAPAQAGSLMEAMQMGLDRTRGQAA